jgi:hypothetical protein
MNTPWPHTLYTSVPNRSATRRLAERVRRVVHQDNADGAATDLASICRTGRFRVHERRLDAAGGGPEAMLSPERRDRFDVWVDPTPRGGWTHIPQALRPTLRRQRVRFRVAHEIGHSFFFRRTDGEPCRVLRDSPEQEAFADDFARMLLVPPAAVARTPPIPRVIVSLQKRFDVSLEVAVRAFAALHPDVAVALLLWAEGSEPASNHLTIQWADPIGARVWRHPGDPMLSWTEGSTLLLHERRQLLWVRPP